MHSAESCYLCDATHRRNRFVLSLTVEMFILPAPRNVYATHTHMHSFHFFSTANYLHICKKSDPHLDECMKTSIDILRPFLVKGIPELDIPSIDPIDIGDLLVSENTRSNGIRISARDIKSYGSSQFVIKSLEWVVCFEKFAQFSDVCRYPGTCIYIMISFHFSCRVVKYGDTYTFEVFFPHMHTEGTYDVSGQVLLLPIKGTGRFLGNFSKWHSTHTIHTSEWPKHMRSVAAVSAAHDNLCERKPLMDKFSIFIFVYLF